MKTKHLINETHCCPVITSAHRFSCNQISCSHRSRVSAVSRLSRCSRGGSEERPGREFVPQLRAGWGFFCFFFVGETGMDPFFGPFLTVLVPESRPDSWGQAMKNTTVLVLGGLFMFLRPFYMRWGGGPCGASCCPEASPGAVRVPQHTVHDEGWRGEEEREEERGRKWREEGDGGHIGWSGRERLGWGGRWKRNKIKDKIK